MEREKERELYERSKRKGLEADKCKEIINYICNKNYFQIVTQIALFPIKNEYQNS